MGNPLISVIVPAYNIEKYIGGCLESILQQDFRDFEVICINDGSSDGTGVILGNFQKRDKRVRVISRENRGQSAARNAGLDAAAGEYICFVDGDDLLEPGALECLYAAARENNADIVGYETAPLVYENENLKRLYRKDEYYAVNHDYPGIRTGREFFTEMVENRDFVDSAWLLFIRRGWLEKSGIRFQEGMLYEDSVFSVRCYFHCSSMMHLKKKLYRYRIRNDSTMTEKITYRHMLSRIWQFSECLRAIYTLAETEREINALSIYAGMCMKSAKYACTGLNAEDRGKIEKLGSLYGLLAKTMDSGSTAERYNGGLCLDGLLAAAGRSGKIILYGAGIVGNKVRVFLEMNGLGGKISGFAVSEKIKPGRNGNLCVQYIGDYKPGNDTAVIVSAGENHHGVMTETAEKLGFKKIYVVDTVMESGIDGIISGE